MHELMHAGMCLCGECVLTYHLIMMFDLVMVPLLLHKAVNKDVTAYLMMQSCLVESLLSVQFSNG